MKNVVIYFSPTGGTKNVAQLIKKELDATEYDITGLCLDVDFTADELVFFCFPVYGGRIPNIMYERMTHLKGSGTPCVPVAVFGNRAVDDALIEMSDLCKKQGFVTVGGAEMVAPHSLDITIAANRPDDGDKAKLRDFLNKLTAKESFTEVEMPGKRPYQKYNGIPVYPHPTKDCIGCGTCYKFCPAEAIKAKKMRTKWSKCMSCMRCVDICASQTRHVNRAEMFGIQAALKIICKGRKEVKFYL